MDNGTHKLLLMGIVASVGFTVYIAGILFGTVNGIQTDVKSLIEEVGYIKGILDGMP